MGCLASAPRLLPARFAVMTLEENSAQKSVDVLPFLCKEADAGVPRRKSCEIK